MTSLFYMQRALELAALGIGSVFPNPMVGCVIVHNNKIIGEGWHKQYGGAHAEVNAIKSVKDKSLLKECDVFVTLEPCSHFGKTPPCADLLIQHKVKSVIIATTDPNPTVAGEGIKKLKAAGIPVETGLLEKESIALNKRFFSFMKNKRPFIVLKWAETADGYIARQNFDSKWISNAYSRRLVHKWRTEEQAILVGTNTAHYDNPQLTARDWMGENPVRLVIDRNLRLSSDLHLFDHKVKTICYNLLRNAEEENLKFVQLKQESFFHQVLHDLYEKKIMSVLVEGGTFILNEFLEQQLWDEIRVFKTNATFQDGIAAPKAQGQLIAAEELPGGDTLFTYKPME